MSRRFLPCGRTDGPVVRAISKISYSGYRSSREIIQQALWFYLRFTLSFRDVEDLLAERGITVSYETIRRWVNHLDRWLRPTCAGAGPGRTEPGIWTRSF